MVLDKFIQDYHLVGREVALKIIEFISMERVTPDFQKLVNSNIDQRYNLYYLPCGVSWGSNTLYIAKQKDGFAITKYKKLRKQLLGILELL